MIRPYLLHPALVHFPIAWLPAGLAAALLSATRPADARAKAAASWLLWLGTAAAWLAAGLGLLAERTAPHVPLAWKTLDRHETLAWCAVAAFTALSLWRGLFGERGPRVFLLAWLAAAALLLSTAFYGGALVFTHNMGTAASAQ